MMAKYIIQYIIVWYPKALANKMFKQKTSFSNKSLFSKEILGKESLFLFRKDLNLLKLFKGTS